MGHKSLGQWSTVQWLIFSITSPPFFLKAFFFRPLVPLLIFAPGPKCLGVKTSPCRGRGGLRSPQLPFSLIPPPLNPRGAGRGSLPRTTPAQPPAPSRVGALNGVWLDLSRGPGKLPNSAWRPNRRQGMQGQTVPSQKEGGLKVTTVRRLGRTRRTRRASEAAEP